METYDIIMLVVLVGATLFGAIKGFAWQLASIASFVFSYWVAYNFREPFSQSIQAEPPWNRFLAMLILFVGTSLVIWVAFRMISNTIDRLKLKEFDRQIGAVFRFTKGILYCTIITFFAVTLLGDKSRDQIVTSKSGNYIAKILDRSQAVIPPELHEVVQPHLDKFDQKFNAQQPAPSGGFFKPFAEGIQGAGQGDGSLPDSFWQDSIQDGINNLPRPNLPLPTEPKQWLPADYQQALQPGSQQQPWSNSGSSLQR